MGRTNFENAPAFAPPVTKRAIALGFATFVTSRHIYGETAGLVFEDADFPRLRWGGIIFGDAGENRI